MELTKGVAENVGKVFLNIGQGTILGSFVSQFLGKETLPSYSLVAFAVGIYTVYIGLWFISESEKRRT